MAENSVKLIAKRPQRQLMMSKSTSNKNSINSQKPQVKQKSESVITIKSNRNDVQEKPPQIKTLDNATKKVETLDLLQDFPILETKRAKSAILGSTRCSKKNVPKTRKRTTVWTKFPPEGVTEKAPKVQKPKPTSVYKQGISFSDVLFSAGPCCTVNIKSVPTEKVEENIEGPSMVSIENFPTPDQKVFGVTKSKLKRGKQLSGSLLCQGKAKKQPVEEISEAKESKPKIEFVQEKIKTVEEVVKAADCSLSKPNTLDTLNKKPVGAEVKQSTVYVPNSFQTLKNKAVEAWVKQSTVYEESKDVVENIKEIAVREPNTLETLQNETVKEELKVVDTSISKPETFEKSKTDPSPENFETVVLKKVKSTNKLDLLCLIDAPSSSDENANVSEPSESDSESNIGYSSWFSQKTSSKKPETEADNPIQQPLKPTDSPKQEPPLQHDNSELQDFIPRQYEKPEDNFYGIPWWNFTNPYSGPEVFPRPLRPFLDEPFLYAEDLANLALKLARGK